METSMARTLLALTLALLAVCGPAVATAQDAPKLKAVDRQRQRKTRDTMKTLAADLASLLSVSGSYTENLDEIVRNNLREAIPPDAWGNKFSYRRTKSHDEKTPDGPGFELVSFGADGRAGGQGADTDLTWTERGELRTLSADEKAELERKRAEQLELCRRALAYAEMKVLGALALAHLREKGVWPADIAALKPKGATDAERALLACFTDPWAREYEFKPLPHENFAVICRGSDSKEGGKGPAADFVITERDLRQMPDPEDGWDYEWQNYATADLADSVRSFKKLNGRLPRELDELTRGQNPVRTSLSNDRHGNPHLYIAVSEDEFYVISLGSDRQPGGIGDAADAIAPKPGADPAKAALKPGVDENEAREEAHKQHLLLVEVADAQMQEIARKLAALHEKNGAWPESLDAVAGEFPGGKVPLDPWGNAYSFSLTRDEAGKATGFTVTCLSSDGAAGGSDLAADFGLNQELERQGTWPGEDPPAGDSDGDGQ
jgi:hypothetical protein